jgi:hypothetical protein
MAKDYLKTLGIVAAVLAIAFISIYLANLTGLPNEFTVSPSGGSSGSQGLKLLGMSSVYIASNFSGTAPYHFFQGSWWVATAIVGGLENINVNQPGSSFAPNQSYVCNASCQKNNLQIQTTFNKIFYPVTSSGTPIDSYYIAYLGNSNPVQLTFNTCPFGSSTTVLSNQPQYFSKCDLVGVESAALSYTNACTAKGGRPLQVDGTGFDWGCYELVALPVAYVYQMEAGQVHQGVSVTLNGQTETVNSQNNTFNDTLPDMAVYYLSYAPGSLNGALPSPSDGTGTSVLVIANASLASRLNKPNASAILEGGVLQSQVSSLQNNINGKWGGEVSLAQAASDVQSFQLSEQGLFVQNQPNSEFAGAAFAGTQQPSLFNNFASYVPTYVVINDSQSHYAAAEVQLLIQAQSLGLYLGSSTFSITSTQLSAFRSGYTSILSVGLQNTGSSQGGFQLTVTPNQGTVSSAPEEVTGSLNPGQMATEQFTIGDNEQSIAANSNVSRSVTVKLCSLQNQCSSKVVYFSVLNPCQNNVAFNAGTCQAATTVPFPTTSVPGGQNSSTTTVQPCNPLTGQFCPAQCPPSGSPTLTYYNATLGECTVPPGWAWWMYLLVIGLPAMAIAGLLAYAYMHRR